MAPLATMAFASARYGAFQRQMSGKGVVRAGKGINLVISNEDMDDTIRIMKSLENLAVLIDRLSETVKQGGKKKKKVGFLVCYKEL